jgi:hypothetical protein
MKRLLDALPAKLPEFDTLVHLGAGPFFDADLYAALPARRYILVEADPDSAADLQQAAPAPFEVFETLVAPAPGPHQFRRFSLPALNGLLGLGAWQTIYPRAREIAQLRLTAVTPAQLLADLVFSAQGSHALVLGLPGLESDLLSGLFNDTPFPFDWIFLTGAGTPLRDQAKPLSEALQVAGEQHFQINTQDAHSDPLQPVALLQRDRRALELQSLRQERETLSARVSALESEKSELAACHKALVASEKDLATRHTSLVAAFGELERNHTPLATALEELQDKHASLSTLHTSLVAERDAAVKERENFKLKLAETEKAGQELAAARDSVAGERDNLQARTKAAEDAWGAITAERNALEGRVKEVEGAWGVLAQERDKLQARVRELEVSSADAAKERDALKQQIRKLEEAVERQKIVSEETAKAEGQLEMLKDLLRPALT